MSYVFMVAAFVKITRTRTTARPILGMHILYYVDTILLRLAAVKSARLAFCKFVSTLAGSAAPCYSVSARSTSSLPIIAKSCSCYASA